MSVSITRPQLAKIAQGDQALLRALELLFDQSGQVTREEYESLLSIATGLENQEGAGDARMVTGLPVNTDYVDFARGAYSPAQRRMGFSDAHGTVEIGLLDSYTQNVGQALHFYAKNTRGATLPRGSSAMFTGTVGASGALEFGAAVANGSQPPEYMMGIVASDVANNAFGYVVSFGLVRGFNTSGGGKTVPETWADGDILYFDPVYAGELTKVQPVAPNLDLPVAVVLNAATGGSGSIFVRMKAGERLNDLHDVYAPSPVNGAGLAYSTANARWEQSAGVLGTVAMAGGMPTGAILQTGSNANGSFLRFADGTMVCWRIGFSITPVANTPTFATWSFPSTFIAAPAIFVTAQTTNIGLTVMGVSYANPTTTTADIYVYRTNTTATTMAIFAVGKWV